MARAATCGNGIVEGPEEECDPHSEGTFINGNPEFDACTSGGDCFFKFSCCKFNCQFVGNGPTCDDGNPCTGDGQCRLAEVTCSGAAPVAAGTACGNAAATECTAPDTCDGMGACLANDAPLGTPCGDPATTSCTAPDSCDGNGSCLPNDAPAGTPAPLLCEDGEGCTLDECDGAGGCQNRPVGEGEVCRASQGPCDIAEVCTGGTCPADTFLAAGTECRAAAGPCDVPETCTGTDAMCPADAFVVAGTACRPAAGPCDLAETCTGSEVDCPPDAKSTTVCREAAGPCDAPEVCDSVTNECPPDALLPAGALCDDGNPCTAGGACDGMAPTCPTGTPIVCPACEACDGAGGCVIGPLGICRTVTGKKARLIIKNRDGADRDVLVWKFNKFIDNTEAEDFGDPTRLDHSGYHFCLFQDVDPAPDVTEPSLVAHMGLPPGPPWSPAGTGFKYKLKTTTPKSLLNVRVRAASGIGKVNVKAKGAAVPDIPLQATLPVFVHFQSENACWEASYSFPKRNDSEVFKALAD